MNSAVGGIVVFFLFGVFLAVVAFIFVAAIERAKNKKKLYEAAEKYLKS
jgi:hypothetical protein